MNTTICGVDDRMLYVIGSWAVINLCIRAYEAWNGRLLSKKLRAEAERAVDSRNRQVLDRVDMIMKEKS